MTTMIEKIEAAIEKAARQSVPWPEVEISPSGWDVDGDEVPQSLEHFVNGTYIGEKGGDAVFKAAASAATRAALNAMLEPSETMLKGAATNVYFDQDSSDLPVLKAMLQQMIQAALDEKEG